MSAHLADLPKGKPVEIWFQDEARIGQKNGVVRQWAQRGTRPRQPADQRYTSAYLFGAICPARGVGAGLAMPYADTEAMQAHINEISRHVARGAHAVLLMDRAGWHTTAKLNVPKNITPIWTRRITSRFWAGFDSIAVLICAEMMSAETRASNGH